MTLDFIFRLVLYSREDVSFNIICLNVLEDTKQFNLLMWFKKTRFETMLKGDDVKALIKTSNCEKWSFITICKPFFFVKNQWIYLRHDVDVSDDITTIKAI